MSGRRTLTCSAESWEFKVPFTITGYTFTTANLLYVTVSENGSMGRGEAAGVYYLDETRDSMLADVESVRDAIEQGATRVELQQLLRPGGARNALDCALWDLEAKQNDTTIWNLTGIEPHETHSVMTISLGTPEEMAAAATSIDNSRLKVKLNAESPIEHISAVRDARPDAEIIVDVNQGWTFEQLEELAARFDELGVAMIEQPLARGGDEALEDFESPVPLCADESCLGVNDFEQAARRYQVINIKLDKTGGLTGALELARLAQAKGLELMVGSMMGTSLGMAPAFVIAQLCKFVDLDGALFLKKDRDDAMSYKHGIVSAPCHELWG